MFWLTFSPVANNTEEYYNISEAQVDLLLNWGPIGTFTFMHPISTSSDCHH
jgi:predicted DNA-binding WGR domain protein